MKKAVLFGASGFIGSFLLEELLNSSDYEQVTAVVRKPLNINHHKLKTLIGDYHTLQGLKENIVADEIFIALGTTLKNTPNKEDYYQIDHDYPVLASKIAKARGAGSVFIVTAIGANAKSKISYVKTKGETERDILALNFLFTHIFRPSMLLGNREEKRPLEKLLQKTWSVVNLLLIGKMNRYKGIEGKDVAKAMVQAAANQTEKIMIDYWDRILIEHPETSNGIDENNKIKLKNKAAINRIGDVNIYYWQEMKNLSLCR
jgi:uncharacterized protein YbjT (DUF2867 family)